MINFILNLKKNNIKSGYTRVETTVGFEITVCCNNSMIILYEYVRYYLGSSIRNTITNYECAIIIYFVLLVVCSLVSLFLPCSHCDCLIN